MILITSNPFVRGKEGNYMVSKFKKAVNGFNWAVETCSGEFGKLVPISSGLKLVMITLGLNSFYI